MKKLNFIGIGGAMNFDLGGNCAYIKSESTLLLLDCCEGCAKKLKDLNLFENCKEVYIAITHTHADHVAGLGCLIWYLNYRIGLKPIIIVDTDSFRNAVICYLTASGVNADLYTLANSCVYNVDGLTFKMMPTTHSPNLECFGIMFQDDKGCYYYSGDTNDVTYIGELCKNPNCKKIYCEVGEFDFGIHIKIDDLLPIKCNKLTLMHFENMKVYNEAIKAGFNIVEIKK